MSQLDLFDDGRNDIVGAADYAAFAERLRASNCSRCSLHSGRANIVVDRGNPSSRLLVIGEGPGAEEDSQGRAFVGRAGKLLDEIMASVGLDTERDMLIANVVKCRPPGNRAPHGDEVAACLPFLQRQIELVQPRLVVLLGATALKHLAPERKTIRMAEEVGRILELPAFPTTRFIVLYHPAALLYNARLKPEQWKHVKTMRRWLEAEGLHPAATAAGG